MTTGAPPAPHLAIVGPTTTGKTALASALARRHGWAELVSVDSMSVYREMDIGTAKPAASEREAAPWHLLDLVDPGEEFSVARFQRAAAGAIEAITARCHVAVLAGGTGLYHRAVVDALEIPGRFPKLAAELGEAASSPSGLAALFGRLRELDPVAASRTEAGNRRRVVRALEVTIGSGRPFSSFGPGLGAYGATGYVLAGLRLDRACLVERLRRRLEEQVAAGLVDEVRRLAARPGGLSRTARQALGYREILTHLEEGVPLDEALEQALRRMRRFAKRQQSWFGRDPRVRWFDAARPDLVEAVEAVWMGGDGRDGGGAARE